MTNWCLLFWNWTPDEGHPHVTSWKSGFIYLPLKCYSKFFSNFEYLWMSLTYWWFDFRFVFITVTSRSIGAYFFLNWTSGEAHPHVNSWKSGFIYLPLKCSVLSLGIKVSVEWCTNKFCSSIDFRVTFQVDYRANCSTTKAILVVNCRM